jgi:glycosyltransferase involved in cell wall biosynthesis
MNFVAQASVAIVIPVHNAIDHLPRTLDVLKTMDWSQAMVIVVDDGSNDGTAEFLETRPELVVVQGRGDLWWSGAVDAGCRAAIERGAEILVLWNDDDVAASANCIGDLVWFVRNKGGCAAPVILEQLGEGKLSVFSAGGAVDWLAGGLQLRESGTVYDPLRAELRCDWLSGNSLAFAADLFIELGGFDVRRFPQYRGDSDFTMRASKRGLPCTALFSCWVVNDLRRTGMNFWQRVGLRQFADGLVSLKSSYHVGSTVRFYVRHCPRRYIALSLAMFYAKYVYATLKTWLTPPGTREPSVGSRSE